MFIITNNTSRFKKPILVSNQLRAGAEPWDQSYRVSLSLIKWCLPGPELVVTRCCSCLPHSSLLSPPVNLCAPHAPFNAMDGHNVTLEFLQDLISQTEPNVTVLSFKVSAGASRGDNFTSSLYRVHIVGSEVTDAGPSPWQRSLIYKQLPHSQARRKLYRSEILFQNEVVFYKEALSALLEFQSSSGMSDPFTAVPRCLLAEQDVIVLEDLGERGFVMRSRNEPLDYQHLAAIFREIARFHALSLGMKCQDSAGFREHVSSRIQETFFKESNEEYFKVYNKTLTNNALSTVSSSLGDSEKYTYLTKFEEFLDERHCFKNMVKFVEPKEPMAVICHGDFWTNNIMFRYADNGDIEEVCFVDFQIVRYSSPALDMVNILYSCVERDVLVAHTDQLVSEYCSTLRDSLAAMGCDGKALPYCQLDNIPQLMQEELKGHHLFGLGLALDMIPLMTCDPTQAPDLYEAEGEAQESMPLAAFTEPNPECSRRMTELVRHLVDQGYL